MAVSASTNSDDVDAEDILDVCRLSADPHPIVSQDGEVNELETTASSSSRPHPTTTASSSSPPSTTTTSSSSSFSSSYSKVERHRAINRHARLAAQRPVGEPLARQCLPIRAGVDSLDTGLPATYLDQFGVKDYINEKGAWCKELVKTQERNEVSDNGCDGVWG